MVCPQITDHVEPQYNTYVYLMQTHLSRQKQRVRQVVTATIDPVSATPRAILHTLAELSPFPLLVKDYHRQYTSVIIIPVC